MSHQILVVETDPVRGQELATSLERAGFAVARADGFESALTRLRHTPVSVVVTAVRLGAYNGLHLIMRGRTENPRMAAILTSPFDDPVVEAEAITFGAEFAVAPWRDEMAFVQRVARLTNLEPV